MYNIVLVHSRLSNCGCLLLLTVTHYKKNFQHSVQKKILFNCFGRLKPPLNSKMPLKAHIS